MARVNCGVSQDSAGVGVERCEGVVVEEVEWSFISPWAVVSGAKIELRAAFCR